MIEEKADAPESIIMTRQVLKLRHRQGKANDTAFL
jgi:hypothetical protein